MLKAGADVLIEAQRAEAQAMGLNETGGFINSIKATDVKGDDTEKYVEIYPQGRAKHGNDRKGDKSKVRYATIGFVAEYGTSSHAARPYMTVANLFKDTRWLLTLLINEALLAEDENAQLLEEKRVGRLIHAGNLQEVQNAIFKSFYRGTAGDNSDTENENDGEETTEEGNRAAVQEN